MVITGTYDIMFKNNIIGIDCNMVSDCKLTYSKILSNDGIQI